MACPYCNSESIRDMVRENEINPGDRVEFKKCLSCAREFDMKEIKSSKTEVLKEVAPPDKTEEVETALELGKTTKMVEHECGVSPIIVRKIRTALVRKRSANGLGPIMCPCGLEAGHAGWCSFRYQEKVTRGRGMKKDKPKIDVPPVPVIGGFKREIFCPKCGYSINSDVIIRGDEK